MVSHTIVIIFVVTAAWIMLIVFIEFFNNKNDNDE